MKSSPVSCWLPAAVSSRRPGLRLTRTRCHQRKRKRAWSRCGSRRAPCRNLFELQQSGFCCDCVDIKVLCIRVDLDIEVLIDDTVCVQLRLACSAGDRPAGVEVRSSVAWIAGWRETKTLKPIDVRLLGGRASHRAVMKMNVDVASKIIDPKAEPSLCRRRQHG